ncbi:MAG TPA: helix-turn-helix transcriptional regulator [Phycisphaerales bacterium]|nr:helix-turn-helix transcriptional regulator [Phycisphaerales bacterium]
MSRPVPKDPLSPVFAALANPVRRAMIDVLVESPGSTIASLAERFGVSGVAALKHVRVLEKARLVVSKREGRERHLHFNAVPIQQIYDRWTCDYARFWTARIVDLKERIESEHARQRSAANRKGVKHA